jgi:signal transduction histidine kinase
MFDFLKRLFDTDFMPHGQCYLWRPDVLWLHAGSDVAITLAYYSIPVILIYFIRQRKDVPFNRLFLMFGAFIFACGTTHLLEVWTLWVPVYRLAGVVKLITAGLSILTAVILFPIVPKALALPSLEESNRRLRQTTTALTRSNRDLEQFGYVVSHDLQEPLRMVASYVQLLKRRYSGRLDADADEYIRFAVEGAVRMQKLIDDLLAYSRLSTQVRPFAPCDCNAVLGATLASLQMAIKESGAVITNQALPMILADATQLGIVLQNLVGNAIKFHGPAPPRIHIDARKDGEEWVFSVTDNGVGIDPQYSDQVFVMFKRLNGRDFSGNGIGLAVCKSIVERHGGRIWFESRPHQGTTFHFSYPLRPLSQPGTAEAQTPVQSGRVQERSSPSQPC